MVSIGIWHKIFGFKYWVTKIYIYRNTNTYIYIYIYELREKDGKERGFKMYVLAVLVSTLSYSAIY